MQDRPLQQNHETLRIPIYADEGYVPDYLSGGLGQHFINCWPEVIENPVTGEKTTRILKRPGNSAISSIKTAMGAGAAADIHVKAFIPITQLTDVFVLAAFDSTRNKTYVLMYRPVAGTVTLIGDIGTTSWQDYIHITEYQQVNSGTLYPAIALSWKAAAGTSSKCWTARSDGSVFTATTLTQITQTGFPDQQTPARICTGPFQQMNGLLYIMCTDGTIWNSGGTNGTPNDATSSGMWNTLSYINTYQSPDKGVGIWRYKHHLVAFSKDSVEFFNDIGAPPPASPLERTQQAFIKFGALGSKSVINVADTLYWIAYGSNSTQGVWKMEGYAPVKISREKQDYQLAGTVSSVINMSQIELFTIAFNSKLHVGINSVLTTTLLSQRTAWGDSADTFYSSQDSYKGQSNILMYNTEDNLWWGYAIMNDPYARMVPAIVYPSDSANLQQYVTYFFYDPSIPSYGGNPVSRPVCMDYCMKVLDGLNYNSVAMVDANPNGTDAPVVAVVQFNLFQFDTQVRKRINKLSLIFDYAPRKKTGDTGTYSINLVYKKGNFIDESTTPDNRYVTYSNTVGRYYFNNLGMGRVWQFCVASLSKDSFGLTAIELDIEKGIH